MRTKYKAWQDNMKAPLRRALLIVGLLVIPLLSMIGNELANRGDFMGIWQFLTSRPGTFLLAYLIYFTIYLFLALLINRSKISASLYGALFLFLSIALHFKVEFRGEPIMLRDMFSTGAAMDILGHFELVIPATLIWGAVFFLAQILLGFLMPRRTGLCIHKRLISLVLIAIFAVEGTQLLWKHPKENIFNAYYVHWSPQQDYAQNGMALSLLFTGQSFVVHEPNGYSQASVKEAAEDDGAYAPKPTSAQKKPHIIAIMGEAYADLRVINDGIVFNDDPFAPMDTAPGNLASGDLVVSIFGGSTATTEFEFLTGYSQRLFPTGTVAYQHYFAGDQPSIVSTLKAEGYDTIAMHPNTATFWSRDSAYSSMGFDRFIDINGFTTPRYRNLCMTDEAMEKVILQKYRDRKPDQPMFLFAVTIENHSPYNNENIGDEPYDFDASAIADISEDGLLGINTHATGTKHTSEMVRNLIDHFSREEEPVMVVLFGDHQPRVDVIQTPVQTDDINSDELLLLKNEYTVPYYIWTNYEVDLSDIPEILSPNTLTPYVLQTAGLEAPRYLRKVYEVSRVVPGFTSNFSLSADGHVRISGMEYKAEWEAINDLLLLEYDTLFGRGYVRNRLWNVPPERRQSATESAA